MLNPSISGTSADEQPSSSPLTIGSDTATLSDDSIKYPVLSSSWKQTLLAWLSMFSSIIAGSSIGPMFKYMETHNINPRLSACWRCQCMLIFLTPIAVMERMSSPANKIDYFDNKPGLQYTVVVHILIAGLAWAGNLLLWVTGISYTTTVHANIMANTYPLILVCWMQCASSQQLSRPNRLEWLGTLVALVGVVVVSGAGVSTVVVSSSNSNNNGGEFSMSPGGTYGALVGDLLCLGAAVLEVVVILNRQETKKYVPLWQYTALTTLIVILCASGLAIVVDGAGVFCLGDQCVFGWMSSKWVGTMLLFGFVIGVICLPGLNYAIQYIPPLVFSSLNLVDPVATGMISWATGLEGIPPLHTWIGGFIVMNGSGIISYGVHQRERLSSQSGDDGNSEKRGSSRIRDDETADCVNSDLEMVSQHGISIDMYGKNLDSAESKSTIVYSILNADDDEDEEEEINVVCKPDNIAGEKGEEVVQVVDNNQDCDSDRAMAGKVRQESKAYPRQFD